MGRVGCQGKNTTKVRAILQDGFDSDRRSMHARLYICVFLATVSEVSRDIASEVREHSSPGAINQGQVMHRRS